MIKKNKKKQDNFTRCGKAALPKYPLHLLIHRNIHLYIINKNYPHVGDILNTVEIT